MKEMERKDEEKKNFNIKDKKSDIFGDEDCVVVPKNY